MPESILAAVVVLGIGLVFLTVALVLLWNCWVTENWTETTGEITVSRVAEESKHDAERGTRTFYRARIAYRYEANGASYEATKVRRYDWQSTSRERVNAIRDRYLAGKQVVVFYNPTNPRQAVLEPGASWFQYVFLGVGFVLTAAGVVQLLQAL